MEDTKLTLDMSVTFYLSIGFLNNREESFTLEQLGFDEDDLDNMTNEEIDDAINKFQEDWSYNFLDSGWNFE